MVALPGLGASMRGFTGDGGDLIRSYRAVLQNPIGGRALGVSPSITTRRRPALSVRGISMRRGKRNPGGSLPSGVSARPEGKEIDFAAN